MASAKTLGVWDDRKEGIWNDMRTKWLPQLEKLVNPYGDVPVERMLGPIQKEKPEFSDHGFEEFTLFYRKPEKFWNEVGLLVPKKLDKTSPVKVHVFFMGGGFWTGDWRFCFWYLFASLLQAKKENAIILAVNYPRFPIASVKHITRAVDDFWAYFYSTELENDCKAKVPGLEIDRTVLMVSGESAGGYVALHSVVHPHDQFDAKVLFLRYPMLRHYERSDQDESMLEFMTMPKDKAEVEKTSKALWELVQEIRKDMEKVGLLSSDDPSMFADIMDRRTPPYGMASAFGSSWVGTWSNFFGMTQEGKRYPDILTEMEMSPGIGDLGPRKAPDLFIYHGTKDNNVPIEVSVTLVKQWEKMFPCEYLTGKITFIKAEGQKHGFDYTIIDEDVIEGKDDEGKNRGDNRMKDLMNTISTRWQKDI